MKDACPQCGIPFDLDWLSSQKIGTTHHCPHCSTAIRYVYHPAEWIAVFLGFIGMLFGPAYFLWGHLSFSDTSTDLLLLGYFMFLTGLALKLIFFFTLQHYVVDK